MIIYYKYKINIEIYEKKIKKIVNFNFFVKVFIFMIFFYYILKLVVRLKFLQIFYVFDRFIDLRVS